MAKQTKTLEARLWESANKLRTNSGLSSYEYSTPVLGLIFLRYADVRFQHVKDKVEQKATGRRTIGPESYHAEGVLYLPEEARYDRFLNASEDQNIPEMANEAMEAIEYYNPKLQGVLPKNYKRLGKSILKDLFRTFGDITMDEKGDVFGRIYEFFLNQFAFEEGQKGGEFFTPNSLVQLIVDVIEPFEGKILDPACGSGGMFIQSEKFRQKHAGKDRDNLSIYGQEIVENTVRLCQMNLAVHGLEGDIKPANTYYENPHDSVGKFDYVMANPPFNATEIDKSELHKDLRYQFGLPRVDNGNFLWIQDFYTALNDQGRAGFVMANSAADARGSELEINKQLIKSGAVDVIISIGPKFFYTVQLPCMLWFLDKGKQGTERENQVLFIDARNIYRKRSRALHDFTSKQIDFLARIVRCYRQEEIIELPTPSESQDSSKDDEANVEQPSQMETLFQDGQYQDIPGICKVATLEEIKEEGWSLNPGRYVGVHEGVEETEDFENRLNDLHKQLKSLNSKSKELEEEIENNISIILNK